MTARDAATQSDPTDEVEADAAATPEPGESTTPTEPVDAEPAGRRKRTRRHRHASGDESADATAAAGPDAAADAAAAPPPRRRRLLLVAVLAVAAVFAAAMVVLFSVTRPDPVAGLSRPQQAALDAASQAAVNLQTFRRASFDQDFANALASLTPAFADQQLKPREDALKKQLTEGGRDATATALSAGLVSSTSTQAVVLVVTNTTQTADDGTSTPFVFSRLQLTLQLTGGKWLVSDLKSVGLS